MKIRKYEIENVSHWLTYAHSQPEMICSLDITDGEFTDNILFYYSPENTKKHHKENLKLIKKGKQFSCKQLLSWNGVFRLKMPQYLYTRLINAYIKQEI